MKSGLLGIVIAIVALVLYWSTFSLTPAQQALVLQFGEVRGIQTTPGLKFKAPWQNVLVIDKRILDLNMPPIEPILADKKRLLVDAFARYRISDPVRFYQSVNNIPAGASRLATFLDSSLRGVLGNATLEQVVRDDRSNLMEQIRVDVDKRAKAIGMEVIDVKIRRADLPEANSQAVFRRMQTERQREATEIRAEGEEQSRRIKSRADRDATVLVAEAERDAEIIRGDGDAAANQIFAEAYGKDPSFFEFYRSMQAYRTAMEKGDTSLVLSPDSDFFRFFNDPSGTRSAPAVGAPQ
ncbi:protease modulator HflC [Pseudovibrio sp. WM33]|uniref:protease modulator HflC n=1 Tax=Pseudovibrio sp. WM33 TaxID=1735585 RepID=UPI0007AE8108|nr:protease modulator HflC [Pseudovibrio sp. WM33]KZL21635.1 Modulator of FtsH protease HflC [Pseudovibrio sp. WM33]